jgi:rubrerythrin
MNFKSTDEILDFAIKKEQEAADFYADLASKATQKYMTSVFEQFSREELGHRAKLEGIKNGKKLVAAEKKIIDLKIGDFLVPVDTEDAADLTYQQALVVAMKREKESFRLYNDLANATDDGNVKTLFLSLAQEEAKHKLRFEVEYDEQILKEN